MADDLPDSEELEIELSSTRIAVQPGGAPAEVSLAVRNTSRVVEQYTIALIGLDPAWFTHSTQTLSLFPGDTDHLVLTFHVPPQPAVTAGNYPFSVIARSRSGALERRTQGALTIAGEAAYQMELAPRR